MHLRKEPSTPKEKKNENQITPRKIPYVTINQPLKSIYSFQDVRISKYCSSIIITGKRIQNFVGLPSLEYLNTLNLDSNPIKSFQGAPRLPNLRYLSIRNSPISRNEYFKLMCLVAFGTSIVMINDMKAPQKYKDQAIILENDLLPELQKGRIISNLKPLRLIDTNLSSRVSPSHNLMEASLQMGYNTPTDKETTKTLIQLEEMPPSIPSVAAICEKISSREDEECYLPSDVLSTFSEQLSTLRTTYNAQYESSVSSEPDDDDNQDIETNSNTEVKIDDTSNKIKSSEDSDATNNQLMNSDSESGGNYSQNSIDDVIIEEAAERFEENENNYDLAEEEDFENEEDLGNEEED